VVSDTCVLVSNFTPSGPPHPILPPPLLYPAPRDQDPSKNNEHHILSALQFEKKREMVIKHPLTVHKSKSKWPNEKCGKLKNQNGGGLYM